MDTSFNDWEDGLEGSGLVGRRLGGQVYRKLPLEGRRKSTLARAVAIEPTAREHRPPR